MNYDQKTTKLFSLLIITIGLFACSSAKKEKNTSEKMLPQHKYNVENGSTFLWEVKGESTTVYLLGSIHIGKGSMYPLDSLIEAKFEESSDFVVELDLKMDKMGEFTKKAMYQDRKNSLKKVLRKSLYDSLMIEMSNFDMPPTFINRMKPWFASTLLMMNKISEAGYNPDKGVDQYFLTRARKSKAIHELESMELQVSMLDSAASDANEFVEYTLKDLENMTSLTDSTLAMWQRGDTEGMKSIIIDPYYKDPAYSDIMDMMFDQRNIRMAEKIEGYLSMENRTFFVVVGSGHLLGQNGIPEILKRKNAYDIKRY